MSLKKIAFVLLWTCVLIGGVSAYTINISAPRTINAGEKLLVNGSSMGLPSGFSTTLQLSEVGHFGIIDEKVITIQEGGFFSLVLDTTTLTQGTYKLELVKQNDYPYGSGSKTWLFFDLIDRRDELSLTAPLVQAYTGSLTISGKIASVGGGGLKLVVEHGGSPVFGPEHIQTSADGSFEKEVVISDGGQFVVTLMDKGGYSWIVTYTSVRPVSTTSTPAITGTTTPPITKSASLSASRNDPAFFRVSSTKGVMRAYTSEGVDWVMEYIDETGVKIKINIPGTAAEEVTLPVSGGTLYFKIYPDRFDDRATVTLYVDNARSIESCTTCAGLFESGPTPTEATPIPPLLVILAIFGVIVLRKLS